MPNGLLLKAMNRRVWAISWPMIVSNISVPLLGLTDTLVLGHLASAEPLAAVTLASNLFVTIVWTFGFLRMGTTSIVARSLRTEHYQLLAVAIRFALSISLLLALVFVLFGEWLIGLYSASSTVSELAHQYLAVRLLSLPLTLANYSFLGWFIGRQNTQTPMKMLVASNAINIVLSIVFVWVLGLGVQGVAAATVVAECVAAFIAYRAVSSSVDGSLSNLLIVKIKGIQGVLKRLLSVNGNLFIRTIILLLVFAYVTKAGAKFGTDVLATNAIILQMLAIAAYALDGIANAVESLTGRFSRYKNRVLLTTAVQLTLFWSFVFAMIMSLIFVLFEPIIVQVITSIAQLQLMLERYYPWVWILPLVSWASYWFDGICLGLGRLDVMLYSVFLAMVVFALLQLADYYLMMGNAFLLASLAAFNIARAAFQWLLLHSSIAR